MSTTTHIHTHKFTQLSINTKNYYLLPGTRRRFFLMVNIHTVKDVFSSFHDSIL